MGFEGDSIQGEELVAKPLKCSPENYAFKA